MAKLIAADVPHAFWVLSRELGDLFTWAIHPDVKTVSTGDWLTAIHDRITDATELTLRAVDCLDDVSLTGKIKQSRRLSYELAALLHSDPLLSAAPAELRYRSLSSELSALHDQFRVLSGEIESIPQTAALEDTNQRTYTDDAIPKGLLCSQLGIADDEFQKRIAQCPALIHPSHGKRDRNVRFDVDALINTELYNQSLRAAAILKWKKKSTSKR
jgi:hypothetical protein